MIIEKNEKSSSTTNVDYYPFASIAVDSGGYIIRSIAQSVYVVAAQDTVLRHAGIILKETKNLYFFFNSILTQNRNGDYTTIKMYRKGHIENTIPSGRVKTYCIDDLLSHPYLRIVAVILMSYLFSRYYSKVMLVRSNRWRSVLPQKFHMSNIISIDDVYGIIFEFMNSRIIARNKIDIEYYNNEDKKDFDSIEVVKKINHFAREQLLFTLDINSRINNEDKKSLLNKILYNIKWHLYGKYSLDDFYFKQLDIQQRLLKVVIITNYLRSFLLAFTMTSPLQLSFMISLIYKRMLLEMRNFG